MKRVLVVDDDPTILNYLAYALDHDHDVVIVPSGGEALRALATQAPVDLIIVDWTLPGMSGPELIAHLRREGSATHDLPIIMLTGRSDAAAEDEAYRAGADAFVTKPGTPELIRSLVDVMLLATDALQALEPA